MYIGNLKINTGHDGEIRSISLRLDDPVTFLELADNDEPYKNEMEAIGILQAELYREQRRIRIMQASIVPLEQMEAELLAKVEELNNELNQVRNRIRDIRNGRSVEHGTEKQSSEPR